MLVIDWSAVSQPGMPMGSTNRTIVGEFPQLFGGMAPVQSAGQFLGPLAEIVTGQLPIGTAGENV